MSENPYARWSPAKAQAATVENPYAKFKPAPKPEAQTSLGSVAHNLITGAGETLLTLPGVPGELALRGIDWAANQAAGTPRLTEEQIAGNPIGVNMTRNMWRDWGGIPKPEAPKTKADEYARTIGSFVGGGLLTGPVNPSTITSGITGGVGAQAAGDLFPDQWWAPFAGGVLGALAPAAAGSALKAPIPKTTPVRAQMAKELLAKDIPVAPGQLATNPLTRNIWDLSRKLSIFDDQFGQKQADAINRVAAKTMGANADDITAQVMSDTKSNLGKEFERIFNTNTVPIDNAALTKLGNIQAKAGANLTDAQMAGINKALDAVMTEAAKNGGTLPGRLYHAFTSKGGALNGVVNNSDSNIAFYGRQIRDALDDAFERTASKADVKALRTVKGQYKNMKTLEPLAARAGEGDISPVKLLSRVATNDKTSAYTGGGDLGLLGRAGQSFLKPPQTSGTAERLGALGLFGNIALSPATFATKKILQSPWLTRQMIKKALRQPTQRQGLLTLGQRAAPVVPGLLSRPDDLAMQYPHGLLVGP